MKKLLLPILLCVGGSVWADCSNTPAYSAAACYTKEVDSLKKQLNQIYINIYEQTEAKTELDNAQKAWLTYREKQCGDFTLADAGSGGGQIIYDLSCQVDLLKSRISYLKSISPTP